MPTQWLESIGLGALAFVLARTEVRRDGDAIATYFAAYGSFRLMLEALRDDPRGHLPGLPSALSPSQWISIALLATACALVATRTRRTGVSVPT